MVCSSSCEVMIWLALSSENQFNTEQAWTSCQPHIHLRINDRQTFKAKQYWHLTVHSDTPDKQWNMKLQHGNNKIAMKRKDVNTSFTTAMWRKYSSQHGYILSMLQSLSGKCWHKQCYYKRNAWYNLSCLLQTYWHVSTNKKLSISWQFFFSK